MDSTFIKDHINQILKGLNEVENDWHIINLEAFLPEEHLNRHYGSAWELSLLEPIDLFISKKNSYIKKEVADNYFREHNEPDSKQLISLHKIVSQNKYGLPATKDVKIYLTFQEGYLVKISTVELFWDKHSHEDAIAKIIKIPECSFESSFYKTSEKNDFAIRWNDYEDLKGINFLGGLYKRAYGRLKTKIFLNNKTINYLKGR